MKLFTLGDGVLSAVGGRAAEVRRRLFLGGVKSNILALEGTQPALNSAGGWVHTLCLQLHNKGCANAHLALDGDRATHQLNEHLAYT